MFWRLELGQLLHVRLDQARELLERAAALRGGPRREPLRIVERLLGGGNRPIDVLATAERRPGDDPAVRRIHDVEGLAVGGIDLLATDDHLEVPGFVAGPGARPFGPLLGGHAGYPRCTRHGIGDKASMIRPGGRPAAEARWVVRAPQGVTDLAIARRARGAAISGALGCLLAACSFAAPPADFEPPNMQANRPQRIGPEFTAASGVSGGAQWVFVAYRSNRGTCMEMRYGGGGGQMSCGDAVGRGQMSVGVGSGPPGFSIVNGEADPRIVVVTVELVGGRILNVPTVAPPPETGLPGRYFVTPILESETVSKITGQDADGKQVYVVPLIP